MKLHTFYANILKSFSIVISDEGFLQIKQGDEYVDLERRKGMRVGLPTEENLKNLYRVGPNGKYIPSYLIFNPLSEQATEDGVSLDILIDCVKANLMAALKVYGELLFVVYNNPKLQSDLPMAINEFIAEAKDDTIPGMKSNGKAIDDTTASNWDKLTMAYIRDPERQLLQLTVPRTKKASDKESNTREARLVCPMWSDIKEALNSIANASDEEQKEKVVVNGVKLRYKDLKIFNDVLTTFMVGANPKGAVVAGTKDTEAPGFIALMLLFHNLMTVINDYLESMANADPEAVQGVKCIIDFNASDIENAPMTFKKELLLIPNENEVNMGSSVVNNQKGVNLNVSNLHPYVQSAVQETQAQQEEQLATVQQDIPRDGMAALLGRNNMGQAIMGAYQGVRVAQPMMGQPMVGQPIITQPVMTDTATTVNTAPKMVSRLNPQYNTQAANQQLLREQYAQQQAQPMVMQPMQPYPQVIPQPMMVQPMVGQPMMQAYAQMQGMPMSPYGNPYIR
jgi:hypothetical protein